MGANQGRLSKVEQEFIRVNSHKMLDTAIAEELGRRVEAIQDFRVKHRVIGLSDGEGDNEISSHLRKSIHWPFLEKQFSEVELKFIESLFKGIVKQFSSDVLVTEELSVIELLKLEVLLNRNLEERNQAARMKERLLLLIEKIEGDKKKPQDIKSADIRDISQQILALDNGGQSRTRELEALSSKKTSILKDLKGTRDQRHKHLEQSKTSFFDWLKILESEDKRDAEGEMLAIYKRAAEKEKKRLSMPHKFADEVVDLPLLSAETVEEYLRLENENSENLDSGKDLV